jgi:hypothetical protein
MGVMKKIGMQRFSGMLSYQLLKNAKYFTSSPAPCFLPEEVQLPGKTVVSDLSALSDFFDKPVIQALQDAMGKTHYLVKCDVTRDPRVVAGQKNASAKSVWRETKE